jgi:hypothetical protein
MTADGRVDRVLGPSPVLRPESAAHPIAVRAISAGTPVSAVVAERTPDGRYVLAVAGERVIVSSSVPLAAGDTLSLLPADHGTHLTLRVLHMASRFDERQYAAATLAQAGAQVPVTRALPDVPDLFHLLGELAERSGIVPATVSQSAAALVARLAAALHPSPGGTAPDDLATDVRRLFLDGGLTLEARLRVALEARQGAAEKLDLDGAQVGGDIRALLAAVKRVLAGAAANAGGIEDAESGPASDAGVHAGPAWLAAHAELRRVTDAVLARQLDAAYEWIRDGAVSVAVPLELGGKPFSVVIRVHSRDQSPEADRPAPAGGSFDAEAELPGLGSMAVRVRWADQQISAAVLVEGEAAARRVEAELPALVEGLRRAGFSRIAADVRIDARGAPASSPPSLPLAGGAIFSARV